MSAATASQVLVELERLDWLTSHGRGPHKERRLKQPGSVLDAWVKQLPALPQPQSHRYFVPSQTIEGLMQRLDEVLGHSAVPYAISYEAAAQKYAPFASSISQVRCRMRPAPGTSAALAALSARPVMEGSNLIVIDAQTFGEFLFRERQGSVWLASPIQVYLDLMRAEGRAKEMADHLRRERIGF